MRKRNIKMPFLKCVLCCSQLIFILCIVFLLVYVVTFNPKIEHSETIDVQNLRKIQYAQLLEYVHNITYTPFNFEKPNFLLKEDGDMFYNRQIENENSFLTDNAKQLQGSIIINMDATIHNSFDCGWQMNSSLFSGTTTPKHVRYHQIDDVVCPLLVAQSQTFQHFMDGVVPKLVQSQLALQQHYVKVLIYRPWDSIIFDILEVFNITRNRIIFSENGYYKAHYLLNTCYTPPLHPTLWNKARHVFTGHLEHLKTHQSVILLTRTDSRNYGRSMNNKQDVVKHLVLRFSLHLRIFRGSLTLNKSVELFSSARLIIGVHGGAFYNIMFASPGTNIIEIMPVTHNGDVVPDNLAYNIVWKMSSMLGLNYWRLMERAMDRYGNLNVNITRLDVVIDEIISGKQIHN